MIDDRMSQQLINKFKPIIFSKIGLIIKHLAILSVTIMVVIMIVSLLALISPKVSHIPMHQQNNYPMIDVAFASPLQESANSSLNGLIGFNSSGIIEKNSSDAIYPAFNYSLTEIEQAKIKDLTTTNSSFLPVPDLISESGLQAHQAPTAVEGGGELTQSAIEKMVNPSSLLSSAIDDIRESGNIDSDKSPDVQSVYNKTISFLNTEFSTIPLYGMNIPPKDYLIISSDEVNYNKGEKFFASARIPCNDKHETALRVVLLENWSSISYPPPNMHLIDGGAEGQLCMFRIEYPENGTVESYVTPVATEDKASSRNLVESTAIALYNSGESALRFPTASSITVTHLDNS
jgi:hypothetical protein